jgi:hypothetical protein
VHNRREPAGRTPVAGLEPALTKNASKLACSPCSTSSRWAISSSSNPGASVAAVGDAGSPFNLLSTVWVSGLTHERLAAPLVYMRRGQKHESPLWWAVAHVFNHQTHHRGQITALLTQQGYDPGITDLFAMLREEAARASVS